MSAKFVTALDLLASEESNLVNGENGCPEHKSTNSALLDLFFKLVRNLSESDLKQMMTTVINDKDSQLIVDLFVLTFQTRDCRGGKGEKMLFYEMLLELFKEYPETVISLLGEIPFYGYYKDFLLLSEMILKILSNDDFGGLSVEYGDLSRLNDSMMKIFANQILKDKTELDASIEIGRTPVLSFACKFAPREGKKHQAQYKILVKKLFGKSRTANKEYRKLVSLLTRALEVPEVLMCAQRYDEINFKKVPSLCLNRCRKAFLNELVTKKGSRPISLSLSEQETGNRHSYDEKRVQCRKNLQLACAEGKVCGKVLQPHELVSQLMKNSKISDVENSVYDAQWLKIKEGVIEGIQKLSSDTESSAINLGKLVPLVDVSGSMNGTPMEVAIALGILFSELSYTAFRNRFITFSEKPTWISLEGLTSLRDKVVKTKAAPWGMNTNFAAAMEMILKVAIEHRLSPEEIPDLIVFSDMQFDVADKKGSTMHERIKNRFSQAGLEICGRPYMAPKIIYWNLRGDTNGHPVLKDTPNTQMLSGFSPSLLKLILDGEPLVLEEVSADGIVTQRQITPEETLRKALDDERYDRIRVILSQSKEGVLSNYTFIPPLQEEE